MKTVNHSSTYYLFCAACYFALAGIEWSAELGVVSVLASCFFLLSMLRSIYHAYLAVLFYNPDTRSGR